MSVYASKRGESKIEYVRTAQELAVYTLKQAKKFPKSYQFTLTNNITRLAMEIHEDVLRANSIYVHKNMSEDEFQLREHYLSQARSAVFALSGVLTVTFAFILEGNNFFGDKEKASNAFKKWAELLNYEAALLKGVADSDKKRRKKASSDETNGNSSQDSPVISTETFEVSDT